jgi:hypothetical protein
LGALFVISGGVDVSFRQFEYNQPITKNLRAYKVNGAPGFAVDLQLFPLAGSGGALGGIGLRWELGIGFS